MKKKLGPKPIIMPMPCLLVGTYGEDGTPNAMTAAWASICCHKPLAAGVALRHSRLTFANLQRKKAFTLNVPSGAQAAGVDYLGTVSGSVKADKLQTAGFTATPGSVVDAPIIDNCPINLECELIDRMVIGSHSWFVGEIKEVQVDQAAVEEDGGLDIQAIDPLIYVPLVSEYRTLGKTVGQAFSIGKKISS